MKEITYEEAYTLKKPFFIDVRSQYEYSIDHIPGAVNVPLFNNEERREIGRIYHLLGKGDAIIRGSEIAGSKIGDIVANLHKVRDSDFVIYCFRGGLRSTSLVSLFTSLDFNIYKLKDGYKGYRKYVLLRLNSLSIKPKVFVIQGLTGTGKTAVLRRLKNSIDLEGMAGHRSSVFGGIGLQQKTQKMFESLLLNRIDSLNEEEYIVFEGESRKIGNLHIPLKILNHLYNSPTILLKASIERRVEILLKEYTVNLNSDEVVSIVKSLSNRIGVKNVNLLVELFMNGKLFEFTRLLLDKYYDPLYKHTLKKMDFIAEIVNINCNKTTTEIERIIEEHIHSAA
ncbi:MAG: tRNA 2-selenouridine(34) synthase MnmH [Spirochaetota bacterium]|nr:tRNA 2-selenouridine(34) synthase MnmH [Spirochaetota bacterium]